MSRRTESHRRSHRTVRSLLALTVSAFVLAACQTGSDGFNDGSEVEEAPDTALIRSFMEGLGAVDPRSQAQIDYKPRAPLAMPTSTNTLPPPEQTETVANWPQSNRDAEIARVQETFRSDGRGSGDLDGEGRSNTVQSRGIQQLVSTDRDLNQELRNEERLESGRMKPGELNQRVGIASTTAANVNADGTPVRRYLIEPPTEYSTPSPDAPMAAPRRVDRAPEISTIEQIMDGRSARTIQ